MLHLIFIILSACNIANFLSKKLPNQPNINVIEVKQVCKEYLLT